jgi:diguanylate cyclase (GGDEF)-like protein/PAS domain S-box-containing protein
VSQEIERTERTLATWADRADVAEPLAAATPGSEDRLRAALRDVTQTNLDAPVAFVSSPAGRLIAAYPPSPAAVGQDFSFRDWYRGVSATGAPYVSSAYRSAAGGQPVVVAIAAPVRFRLTLVGYLVSTWDLTSVKRVAAGAARDDGISVTITDQRGQPLTGDLAVDARGEPLPVRSDPVIAEALTGRQVNRAIDGSLVSARRIDGIGWTVRVSRPTGTALASAADYRRNLALLAALGMLVIAALGASATVIAVRRARERQYDEEERLRLLALFAASPVGIIEAHPNGEILAANAAVLDLLGYSEEELRQLRAQELVAPDSAADIAASIAATLTGEVTAYTAERLYVAKGGERIPVLTSIVALRDDTGQVRRLVGFVVDLREPKRSERELRRLAAALAEREAFLSTLIETMDVGVLACDTSGAQTFTNRQAVELFGGNGTASHPLRHLDGTLVRPADHPLRRAVRTGQEQEEELVVEQPSGARHALTSARPLRTADGAPAGAVAAVRDITATRAAEQALRSSELRFRRVFDEGLTGKFLADRQGRLLRVNAALARQLGRSAQSLQGTHVADLAVDADRAADLAQCVADPSSSFHGEVQVAHADGHLLFMIIALTWIQDGSAAVLLGQVEDITARRAAEARLTDLALHDELTGLPNRRLLLDRCQTAFALAADRRHLHPQHVGALFLDLDGFKPVNDSGGHELGDRVLVDIATRLRATVRPTDTVSRVGGDEFVVLIPEADPDELRELAERVRNAAHREIRVADRTLEVSASVGVALVDVIAEPDVTPETLLRRADAAMYLAKDRGKNRHEIYDAELQASTEGRLELEAAVREGLQEDRMVVVFQPVVDVESGRLVGAETLMRLRDGTGRLLPTLASVRAAEGIGVIAALTDQVLARALRTASLWSDDVSVAVNISPRELQSNLLRERVERALHETPFPPGRLVLEITESSIIGAGESSLRDLDELRRLGVRVAIDDFGTAYATLANLTTLPVDILKVDASFTAGLPRQQTHTAIVHGLAAMAHEMGIPCVVEGVETLVQYQALRGLGVYAQGWLWGEPTPEHEVLRLRSIPLPRSGRP